MSDFTLPRCVPTDKPVTLGWMEFEELFPCDPEDLGIPPGIYEAGSEDWQDGLNHCARELFKRRSNLSVAALVDDSRLEGRSSIIKNFGWYAEATDYIIFHAYDLEQSILEESTREGIIWDRRISNSPGDESLHIWVDYHWVSRHGGHIRRISIDYILF